MAPGGHAWTRGPAAGFDLSCEEAQAPTPTEGSRALTTQTRGLTSAHPQFAKTPLTASSDFNQPLGGNCGLATWPPRVCTVLLGEEVTLPRTPEQRSCAPTPWLSSHLRSSGHAPSLSPDTPWEPSLENTCEVGGPVAICLPGTRLHLPQPASPLRAWDPPRDIWPPGTLPGVQGQPQDLEEA